MSNPENHSKKINSPGNIKMPNGARYHELFLRAFRDSVFSTVLFQPGTGIITDVNQAFLKLTGYRYEDIAGYPINELSVFKSLLRHEDIGQKIYNNIRFTDFRAPFLTADGRQYTGNFSFIPLGKEYDLAMIQLADITKLILASNFQESLYTRYRNIISHINTCVAIYQVRDNGERFIFSDFNRAAEKTEKINKEDLIGKEIRDVFPGAVTFGLIDIFKEVYRTGKAIHHPITWYEDNRISGWRDNYVYKLPNDEILVTYEDRTEEKLFEEKLKESEVKYREMADLLPEVIFETDKEGFFSYANKMALKTFRYTSEEIANKIKLEMVVIPEERLKARREVYRQLRGKISKHSVEFTGLRKDGTTFPITFRVSPIIRKGEFQGVRGILNDLTIQKRIQEHLKRDKTYLEQLIQLAPEAIAQTYKDGTILKINNEFTSLFGYREEDIKGMTIDELLSHGDPEVLKESTDIRASINQGNKILKEAIRYRKNGSPVHVSLLAAPIIFENHWIGAYAIYRDISEQKRNERITDVILNISTAALASTTQEEFFQVIRQELENIVNAKNLFIAMYKKEDNTLYFPYHADEKDGSETFREISADGTITGYVIRKGKPIFLKTADVEKLEKEGEIDIIGTPSKVWLGVPLKVDREIIGIISVQDYNDENALTRHDLNILKIISNQIALAINHIRGHEMLRTAKEKAEENALFKEQFLSTMSHEIRTPLNAIIGMSRLLSGTDPSDAQKEYIKALKISGENLLRLINDILDFSKLEAGKMVTEDIEFDPVEQIKGLTQTFTFSVREKGLALNLDLDPHLPEKVIGDPTRINQIMTNLIGNAIKFTQKGTVTVSAKRLKEDDQTIQIQYSVADTGIGIPSDKLSTIFDSFTQAEKSTTRKFGGTGLGLAISKKIAGLLGTDIHVESTVGEGTTFTFILTLQKTDKPKTKELITDFQPDMLKGKKALIAEDNMLNRVVAKQSMMEWGITVDEAEDGKEAVEKVKQQDYDIILMDLQMPVMDGYEASRLIRALPDKQKSQVPIVALTASALLDIRTQVFEYGMNDVLMKPFRPADLQKMIFRLITRGNNTKPGR